MTIYIILLILPLLFALLNYVKPIPKKAVNILFWGLCALFTLVAALRYNVGTDYKATYATVFNWLKYGMKYNYEPLFLNLNYFFINHGGKIYHLTGFCSLITIPAFFLFIKKNVDNKYLFFMVFAFIGATIYYATLNIIRQYLAIAVFLIAYNMYNSGKKKTSFILALSCYFIHNSSIFMLLIFILSRALKKQKTRKMLYIIYIISIIFIVLDVRSFVNSLSFLIPSRYLGYLNSVFMLEKNYSAVFKLLLPNFIVYVCMKNSTYFIDEKKMSFGVAALLLNVILSNMFYGVNVIIRLTFYCDYFILIVLPHIIDYFYEKNVTIVFSRGRKKLGEIVVILIVVYFILLNSYSIFYKNGHGVIPYKSILGEKL